MNTLARLFSGEPPPEDDAIRKSARTAARKAQVVVAVSSMVMRGARQIDEDRHAEAGGDPVLNAVMARIEAVGIAQLEAIQRGVTPEPWDLPDDDLRS